MWHSDATTVRRCCTWEPSRPTPGSAATTSTTAFIPAYDLTLWENSRPAWVLEPAGSGRAERQRQAPVTWIPSVDNMLEDALLIIALHVESRTDLRLTAQRQGWNWRRQHVSVVDDVAPEQRQEMYRQLHSGRWHRKIVVSVLRGSSLLGQISRFSACDLDIEVLTPTYCRNHSVWRGTADDDEVAMQPRYEGAVGDARDHLVFVYGTLRRHQPDYPLLDGAAAVAGQAWTPGILYDGGGGYPVVAPVAAGTAGDAAVHANNRVYGEVYRVSEAQLARLDALEGYREGRKQNLFDRVRQKVVTDRGPLEAWVYVQPGARQGPGAHIPSGDWKFHQARGKSDLHYLAYGSVMDDARLRADGVLPHFQDTVGRGVLPGYTLAFTRRRPDGGRADLVETDGTAEGKVFRIGQEALAYLLRREGVGVKAYRPAFVDVWVGGTLLPDVLTFLVVDKQPETAPPLAYAREIIRGGTGVLSPEYLSGLAAAMRQRFGLDLQTL